MAAAGCGDTQEAEETAVEEAERVVGPTFDYGPVEVEPRVQSPVEASDCNLARAENFIGEKADSDTRSRLLDQIAPLTQVRWVGPGEPTSEELRPTRLNVMLDADDTIIAVSCG